MYQTRELLAEIAEPVRGAHPHHKRLHRRVAAIAAATACLDVIATLLMYLFHGLEPSRTPDELGRAAVWTASQLLTGGSSLSTGSVMGHVLEVVLELWAITVVAALAGSVATFFQQHDAATDQT
jgi:hypothetical protein